MNRLRLVVAVVLATAVQAAAYGDDTAVFAKVGLPKITGKKWVALETGDSTVSGWLLQELPKEVELLTRGMVRRWFPRKGAPREQDFDALCASLLTGKAERSPHDTREGGLDAGTEAALFAHWQRERGKDEVAKKLVAFVEGRPDHATEVLNGVVNNLRWQAIKAAHEGERAKDLVERWKVIEALPENARTEEARSTVIAYETQAHDDMGSKLMEPHEFAKQEPEERARYWGRCLRDHDGRPDGPRDELAKLGWDAIPILLEGIATPRPTRAMRGGPDLASFELVTTGDCCRELFEEMTGEKLPPERRAAADAARDWWDSVQEKERAILIAGVEKGDGTGAARAARLARVYPEDALPALKKGMANAKEDRARARFVAAVAQVPGDESLAVLDAEAKEDRPVVTRIEAVRGLIERGRKGVARALVPVWEKGENDRGLIQLLAVAGDPECVRALAKDLKKRAVATRRDVILALDAPPIVERTRAWDVAADELLASEQGDTAELDGKVLGELATTVRALRGTRR